MDVNINEDADPMWSNMAALHRLRRATAGAGDATFGENTSGAIANHRDRITALMRATFGRRTMRLGRMAAFGSAGDFVVGEISSVLLLWLGGTDTIAIVLSLSYSMTTILTIRMKDLCAFLR